jgi:hypothetical protein
MRTLLTLVLVLALLVGAIALYLFVTTPKESVGVRFPLTPQQRALIERVPAAADSFALLPTAGPLKDKLLANPVTRDPFLQWADTLAIPSPWMLGGADIVAWRDVKRTSYAIRVDTVRAFLVRIWMMWTSDVDARWDGTAFVINGHGGARIQAAELEPLLELAKELPPGDMLIVQRNRDFRRVAGGGGRRGRRRANRRDAGVPEGRHARGLVPGAAPYPRRPRAPHRHRRQRPSLQRRLARDL